MIAPTTTTRLATRMIAASQVARRHLPAGFYDSPALEMLLSLHVAEEDAHYPSADALASIDGIPRSVADRWLGALIKAGLIERHGDLLALSTHGHVTLTALLKELYDVQRSLD